MLYYRYYIPGILYLVYIGQQLWKKGMGILKKKDYLFKDEEIRYRNYVIIFCLKFSTLSTGAFDIAIYSNVKISARMSTWNCRWTYHAWIIWYNVCDQW